MKRTWLLSTLLLIVGALLAQDPDVEYMKKNYDVFEYRIPMRDGAKLFTLVYIPKDRSKKYPILLNRTCYNASEYRGFRTGGHPSKYLVCLLYTSPSPRD